jgi:hypothetical protein
MGMPAQKANKGVELYWHLHLVASSQSLSQQQHRRRQNYHSSCAVLCRVCMSHDPVHTCSNSWQCVDVFAWVGGNDHCAYNAAAVAVAACVHAAAPSCMDTSRWSHPEFRCVGSSNVCGTWGSLVHDMRHVKQGCVHNKCQHSDSASHASQF